MSPFTSLKISIPLVKRVQQLKHISTVLPYLMAPPSPVGQSDDHPSKPGSEDLPTSNSEEEEEEEEEAVIADPEFAEPPLDVPPIDDPDLIDPTADPRVEPADTVAPPTRGRYGGSATAGGCSAADSSGM